MRKLTDKEIQDIADNIEKRQLAIKLRNFALKYYGPGVRQIEAEGTGEYDDEGGTVYFLTSYTICDEQNIVMELLSEDQEDDAMDEAQDLIVITKYNALNFDISQKYIDDLMTPEIFIKEEND